MSFSTLNIGSTALFAAQRAVEVAAHNVANANNDTFTRQRVTITNALPTPGTAGMRGDGDRGTGVTVIDIGRLRDRLADVSYRSEAGVSGAATARADTLNRAETILGTYSDGAPELLSAFLTSWDQLSLTPEDPAARSSVLTTGKQLADNLNEATQRLDQVGREVALRVGDDVTELNGLLESVGKLNYEIVKASTEARSPNDLLDMRDAALDRISALTGARVDDNADGSVRVSIGGVDLVNGPTASTMAATSAPPISVTVGGQPVTPAGEVGGYVSAANVDLPAYRTELDALAVGLRDVVNAVHRAGSGTDGSTGRDFFVGSDAATFAVDPTLTAAGVAASQSGLPADGNNALVLSGTLRTSAAVGGQTVGDGMRALGARMGQAAADAARNARTSAASLQAARTARASTDGVAVDEEMVDLVKFQHSYEAAARVISTADGMLDTLINEMVR